MRHCLTFATILPAALPDCTRSCGAKDSWQAAGACIQTKTYRPGNWKRSTGYAPITRNWRTMISFAAIWTVGSNEFRIEERMMTGKRIVLLLACLLALAIHVVFAQTTATIFGTVNDVTGAAIYGATITATNLETNVTRKNSSAQDG